MMLAEASPNDIPEIVGIERTPGYDRFITCWSENQHLISMNSPGYRYLTWRNSDLIAGFAILTGLDNPEQKIRIKRIAACPSQQGTGRRFIPRIMDYVFQSTSCNRLELYLTTEDLRAHRLYLWAGFIEEGVSRESFRKADGTFGSRVHLAVLRRDWEVLLDQG